MPYAKQGSILATALAAALISTSFAVPADEKANSDETDLAVARGAAKELGEALKSRLMAAMKAGGPPAALGVCRAVAPDIATDVSKSKERDVGRTALRVRNPDNAPDAFERRVLETFVERIAAGADPATLEHTEVVSENGAKVFRYMKAIPMAAEPCLACHGPSVDPTLKAQILDLYPDDAATGFEAGQLRGAFTVRKPLD